MTEEAEVIEPENISDLFDDDVEEPETEPEASEKGETETEEATDSKEEPPPSEEEAEDKSVPREALLDERRKRQEAERKAEELRRKYEAEAEAEEEAPDPLDDPEGYEAYVEAKVERKAWEKRANSSREKAIEKHADYEEVERHFLFLAEQDPDLVVRMRESVDPASFAYEEAKKSLANQEKAIEDRVIERLRKQGMLKEEEPKKSVKTASKVADLTNASAAGKNSEPVEKLSENPGDLFDEDDI